MANCSGFPRTVVLTLTVLPPKKPTVLGTLGSQLPYINLLKLCENLGVHANAHSPIERFQGSFRSSKTS